MRSMLLVKSDEKIEAGGLPTEEERAQMARFTEEMRAAGVLLAARGCTQAPAVRECGSHHAVSR